MDSFISLSISSTADAFLDEHDLIEQLLAACESSSAPSAVSACGPSSTPSSGRSTNSSEDLSVPVDQEYPGGSLVNACHPAVDLVRYQALVLYAHIITPYTITSSTVSVADSGTDLPVWLPFPRPGMLPDSGHGFNDFRRDSNELRLALHQAPIWTHNYLPN
ncbi:hypothetical protein FB107DRAFT_249815 [Schizophyllum commune]